MNISRIEEGLKHASDILVKRPPAERGIGSLDDQARFALFESLYCKAFYANEEALARWFDQPFNLVQVRRRLKLNDYAPAMASFAFSNHQDRRRWALLSLIKLGKPISYAEFQWSIRESLESSMARVQLDFLEKDFLPVFWAGARRLVEKLETDVIRQCLPSLTSHICKLALDHLQVDSAAFKDILGTCHRILSTCPAVFWSVDGRISPEIWLEQFFGSPSLKNFEDSLQNPGTTEENGLDDISSWMLPFIASMSPREQSLMSSRLVSSLMDKIDSLLCPPTLRDRYSVAAFRCLASTLRIASATKTALHSVDNRSKLMDTVKRTLPHIRKSEGLASPLGESGREVLEQGFTFVFQSFVAERERLVIDLSTNRTSALPCTPILNLVDEIQGLGDLQLANLVFKEAPRLIGIEPFLIREKDCRTSMLKSFNQAFAEVNETLSDVLIRVSGCNAEVLQKFLDDKGLAPELTSMLLSSHAGVRSASLAVFKTLTEQSSRKEAIGDALSSEYFADILQGLCVSLRKLSTRKAYAPTQSMIYLCQDVIDILCDPESGLLRVGGLTSPARKAAEQLWHSLWQEMAAIFTTTESWSLAGHNKQQMMVFCQDVMELADALFGEFSVFTSALMDSNNTMEETGKRLVDQTRATINVMVTWLRLKDEFLLRKATALTCSVLKQLKQYESTPEKSTLYYIEDVVTGKLKTFLTNNQKAQLLQALEVHSEEAVIFDDDGSEGPSESHREREPSHPKARRQQPIDLNKWRVHSSESGELHRESVAGNRAIKPSTLPFRSKILSSASNSSLRQPLPSKPTSQQGNQSNSSEASELVRKRKEEIAAKKQRDAAAIEAARQRLQSGSANLQSVEAGSRLKNLGVRGKDHTLSATKSSKMPPAARNNERRSNSQDELDLELFGRDPTLEARESNRRAPRAVFKRPYRVAKIKRDTAALRASFTVDMSGLYGKLLNNWNYFDVESPYPRGYSRKHFESIPNIFNNPTHYEICFERLLLLEAWQSFQNNRSELKMRLYPVKFNQRERVDWGVQMMILAPVQDIGDFPDGELVVIYRSPHSNHKFDRDCKHLFGRTMKTRFMRDPYTKVPLHTIIHVLIAGHGHREIPPWVVDAPVLSCFKFMSLIPLEREYAAMKGLPNFDLCREITSGIPAPKLDYTEGALQSVRDVYEVNQAQAIAIKSACDNDGFTLIQGPPGSGKTKTIVATVGAVLEGHVERKFIDKRILVCAPSNAAVDEITMRLKRGVKTKDGKHHKLRLIRLGRPEAINSNVLDVSFDRIYADRMGSAEEDKERWEKEKQRLESEYNEALQSHEDAKKDFERKSTLTMTKVVNETKKRLNAKGSELQEATDRNKRDAGRGQDAMIREIREDIIKGAEVVCTTLSGAGHELLKYVEVLFDTVIIDEAAQCVEMSALIPLKFGCTKCIMVGDPHQLPPTVFSKEAASFKYEQSLFYRLQQNYPDRVHLLDTQYRMHPEISAFPSATFYDGKLINGSHMDQKCDRPYHRTNLLKPYQIFHVDGKQTNTGKGHSILNKEEAAVTIELYATLKNNFDEAYWKGKVAIISPYKAQVAFLTERFIERWGPRILEDVDIKTTDSFQGRESEVVIFSSVRGSVSGGVGFLKDIRRMNVAITRAQCSFWVVGNAPSLGKSEYWRKMLDNAWDRGHLEMGDVWKRLYAGKVNPRSHMKSTAACDSNGRSIQSDRPTPQAGGATKRKATDANIDADIEGSESPSQGVNGKKQKPSGNQPRRKSRLSDSPTVPSAALAQNVSDLTPAAPISKTPGRGRLSAQSMNKKGPLVSLPGDIAPTSHRDTTSSPSSAVSHGTKRTASDAELDEAPAKKPASDPPLATGSPAPSENESSSSGSQGSANGAQAHQIFRLKPPSKPIDKKKTTEEAVNACLMVGRKRPKKMPVKAAQGAGK